MIVVFFGQPCSGKTTLCKGFFSWTKEHPNIRVHYMDGDKFRSIFKNNSYGKEARLENLKLASNIAHYEKHLNDLILMAFVFPYKEARDYLRSLGHKIMWVYLEYNGVEQRGREHFWVEDFEEPDMIGEEVVRINTSQFSEQESLNLIKAFYKQYVKR